MRTLVVEDSDKLRKAIEFRLRKSGYAVDCSGDGAEGLWLAECHEYDAIILDIMLPSMNGIAVLQKLRRTRPNTPVLMLTVKSSVADRVAGLRAGADDYLGKPFDFEELLARVEALIRRRYGIKDPVLEYGALRIDTSSRTVEYAGQRLELAPREYKLLELLARRPGEVLSRTEIEEHIYGGDEEVFSNAVESAVSALRSKLQQSGAPLLIQTRRGHGYQFAAESAAADVMQPRAIRGPAS